MAQRRWAGRLGAALLVVSLSTGLGGAATSRAVAAVAHQPDRGSSAQVELGDPEVPARLAPDTNLTFTVNSTADAPDAHPGDGICADAAGQCTLRAAIQEADAQPKGSTITIDVPAGTYGLTLVHA